MTHFILLYLLAVLALALVPGPDMLYIISQSIGHGRRLGIAAALGIGTGCFVHIFAVSAGLSSILVHSASALTLVKYTGACYLLYLGILSLKNKTSISLDEKKIESITSWKKVFMRGFLTNVLNPKVALFFLAFLPQFVVPNSHLSIGLQMLILGLLFNGLGTTVNLTVACFFGKAKNWLAKHPLTLQIQQKITGMIFIGFALRLAVFK